jgi:hypothetical protein
VTYYDPPAKHNGMSRSRRFGEGNEMNWFKAFLTYWRRWSELI